MAKDKDAMDKKMEALRREAQRQSVFHKQAISRRQQAAAGKKGKN